MLDFLKVPGSIPVNNVSWEKIECRNKIPRRIVFFPGKMFPLRKNSEIRQTKNRNPYCLHTVE
jgi:hypothetical protein